ncbi:GNAT family N-acetyltransferase [Coraliomargarita parva]|uniref:GNAT family N-acetyltransferase n=1 Tax=Coraliomargarita parva TaxID=3014050 RepID=UPI0022B481A1|nr:GNAT family N-acetyltransferase [Coraliomargarita parva]
MNTFTQLGDLRNVRLTGKRIVLAAVELADAPLIFESFTPEVTRYLVPVAPSKLAETESFLIHAQEVMSTGTDYICTVKDRKSGEFLGCSGIHGKAEHAPPELGIWLKTAVHGRGYGQETIRLLCDWLFAATGSREVLYPVDRANLPSRHIPEKLGGVLVDERTDYKQNGEPMDVVVYRIDREVYLAA